MLPLQRPGEAAKGLRSLRGGGRGWGCSRDQALVSGFAISHSVLMWRVCLNNLTGRLINQALAFVCRLKAEIAIRRNTWSGAAQPSLPPAPPFPLPLLLAPGLGSFISCFCPLSPAPGAPGLHTPCASVSPLQTVVGSVASSGNWSSFHPPRKLCPKCAMAVTPVLWG